MMLCSSPARVGPEGPVVPPVEVLWAFLGQVLEWEGQPGWLAGRCSLVR